METEITGRVWRYGDDVNTDVIFPGKYTYSISDREEMAQHALEDLDPDFAHSVQPGDIIVAGKNWGCGSSREQAVTCLKEAGVAAIIARSFARIYFRNCINEGLPIVTCDAVDGYAAELAYMAECVRSGRAPTVVTAAEAAESIRIVEAEVRSVRTGQVVEL